MKCPSCGTANRKAAKFCSDCGANLSVSSHAGRPKPAPAEIQAADDSSAVFWTPDWKWHLRALAAIYVFLIIVYFVLSTVLSRVPKPYRMRDIPPEMTPWLKH